MQHSKQAKLRKHVKLQPHQQRVVDAISGEQPRLLLYHGLGTGKSLAAIAAAEQVQQRYGGSYGIVTPASLRPNFQKELRKFTDDSAPEILSYTGLGAGKRFRTYPATLVLDEAHRLKNPATTSTQAANALANQAARLVLLTGSPITNGPADLASLLSLLSKQKISPERFEELFIAHDAIKPTTWQRYHGVTTGTVARLKNEPLLRRLLKDKVDYQPARKPEGVQAHETVVRVPLSSEQQRVQQILRDKIPSGFRWKLDHQFPLSRTEASRLNTFLTGLRQVSLSTKPYQANRTDALQAFDYSSKLQEAHRQLLATLQSDARKKAIIYSNFVDAGLLPYAAALQRSQIPHALFHGSLNPRQRQQALDAYNQGRARALLLGPAGAEGISTQGTSLVQLLDPHWHEARSQQATGRALRFDSHTDLPPDLKTVKIERYLSTMPPSRGLLGLLKMRPVPTGDELLERLTAEKEHLNNQFRAVLRSVGERHVPRDGDHDGQIYDGTVRERAKAAELRFAATAIQGT
jgi:SNF2 family DNA or RNA helicase